MNVLNARQHPLQYCKPSDRFVVMLEVGQMKKDQGPAYEPLAYGMPGQPSPEMLLRRGSRASSFATEDEAREALKKTADMWKAEGMKFHIGKRVVFLKVEVAP